MLAISNGTASASSTAAFYQFILSICINLISLFFKMRKLIERIRPTEQAPPPFLSFHHFFCSPAKTPISCNCNIPSLNCGAYLKSITIEADDTFGLLDDCLLHSTTKYLYAFQCRSSYHPMVYQP